MRLALFHDLPSGGAKRAVADMTRQLAARHPVDVYTLDNACHDFADLRPHAQRHQLFPFRPSRLLQRPFGRLNQLQRWRDLARLDRLGQQIAAAVDAHGYDVLLAHPSRWSQAPLLLRHVRTRSVYYMHEPLRRLYEPRIARPHDRNGWTPALDRIDPLIAAYRRRLRRLDRLATRRATRRLTNSRFTAAAVATIYGCAVDTSYLGVDTDRFCPPSHATRQPYVLSVGTIQPAKGFDFLIAALGHLPPALRPPLHIVANASDPAERAYLAALAHRHAVTVRIEMLIDDSDLARRYAEAALVLYAPVREPFGLVTLEALACGTAVVAVAEGGIPEVMRDGVTGRLTARDESAFAEAVGGLLASPELAARYGAQGRAHVLEHWTWARAIDRLEAALAAIARP